MKYGARHAHQAWKKTANNLGRLHEDIARPNRPQWANKHRIWSNRWLWYCQDETPHLNLQLDDKFSQGNNLCRSRRHNRLLPFPPNGSRFDWSFWFVDDIMYFLVTSHVFGSNTSCSSWEPFQGAIQVLIRIYLERTDLVEKHAELLSLLKWDDLLGTSQSITPAIPWALNQGVLNNNRNVIATNGNIYVDDILSAGVSKDYVKNFLQQLLKQCLRSVESLKSTLDNAPSCSKNGLRWW